MLTLRRFLLLAAGLAATLAGAVPAHAVTGGRPASEPYPWMASVQSGGEHFCGGSLVAPRWVLTAAHCADGQKADKLRVVLDRPQLSGSGGDVRRVDTLVIHEDYRTDRAGGHDIALLRLDRAASVAPLPLVGLDQRALWSPGSPVRVIGWGTSFFLVGPSPDTLAETDVEVIDDPECARAYDNPVAGEFDARTQLCAGQPVIGVQDACQGDSGGPLLARAGGGWTQVGVVSAGLGCGLPLFYGLYARVGDRPLHDWIAARIAESPRSTPPAPGGSSARLSFRKRIKRKRRALILRVRTTAELTNVRATIKRRGRVVARGKRARLAKRGRIRLAARSVRPGAVRVRVDGIDADGKRTKRRGRGRIAR